MIVGELLITSKMITLYKNNFSTLISCILLFAIFLLNSLCLSYLVSQYAYASHYYVLHCMKIFI